VPAGGELLLLPRVALAADLGAYNWNNPAGPHVILCSRRATKLLWTI